MNKLVWLVLISLIQITINAQKNESYLGKTDYQGLIKAIPALPSTCAAAFEYAFNNNINANSSSIMEERFSTFNHKMELYSNEFAAAIGSPYQDYAEKKGKKGLYNDSKKQANQNEIIKNMGGVDNIQKMSEQQRINAAKNAAVNQATGSTFSPFTEEQVKRMMNDPEYAKQMAAKYNNMTDKQKAEMVKNKLPESSTTELSNEELESEYQDYEATLKKRQTAKNTMDINLFVADLYKGIAKAGEDYDKAVANARISAGNHDELDKRFEEEYKKIPLVIMGEGKEPDHEKVKSLSIQYAKYHLNRANMELAQVEKSYKAFIFSIEQAIADYHKFLDKNKYRVNGKVSDIYKGTNTELSLAQAEQTIGSAIAKAGNICYDETSIAAGFEQNYRATLSTYK